MAVVNLIHNPDLEEEIHGDLHAAWESLSPHEITATRNSIKQICETLNNRNTYRTDQWEGSQGEKMNDIYEYWQFHRYAVEADGTFWGCIMDWLEEMATCAVQRMNEGDFRVYKIVTPTVRNLVLADYDYEYGQYHVQEPNNHIVEGEGIFDAQLEIMKAPINTENVGGKGFLRKFIDRKINQFPPNVQKVLKTYGTEQIQSITLLRTPVPSLLLNAINFASLGSFNQKRGDQILYHLRMDIQTAKGKVSLEKNERINMEVNPPIPKDTEIMAVHPAPLITINQLLQNTQTRMGTDFFTYQAKGNNCQVFLLNVLNANGIDKQEYNSFVKQDTSGFFNDSLRKITNTVTDVGALANVIRQGGSLQSQRRLASFAKLFKSYKSKNEKGTKNLKSLEDFANFIIQYPYKFTKALNANAQSYLSVVENKKLSPRYYMGRKGHPKGGDLGDDIRRAFEDAGEAIKPATLGINPAKVLTSSFDLGHDVIGPALFGSGVHIHHHHYHSSHPQGRGVFDIAKKVAKTIAPAVIDEGAKKLKEVAGNNGLANTLIDAGSDAAKSKVDGMGFKKARNVSLKVHGKVFKTMTEKMAYLRSLRGK